MKLAFDPAGAAAEMSRVAMTFFENKAKQGNAGELAMAKQSVVAAGKTRQALATNDAEDVAAAIVANTTALEWAQDKGLKGLHQQFIDYFKKVMAKTAAVTPDFLEAVNHYVDNEYDQALLDVIAEHPTEVGIEKSGSPMTLYRGVFFNDLSPEQLRALESSPTLRDRGMSWSKHIDEARAFAADSNKWDFNEAELHNFGPAQAGAVLVRHFLPEEIIIDLDFAIKHEQYADVNIIEEDEVLVVPSLEDVQVLEVYTANGKFEPSLYQ